jgi:hypothetical protein
MREKLCAFPPLIIDGRIPAIRNRSTEPNAPTQSNAALPTASEAKPWLTF